MVTPALSWASSVEAPRCGRDDHLRQGEERASRCTAPWRRRRARRRPRCRRGWPRPAPPRRRCRPRAVLMIRMPGLALASRSRPKRPIVSGVLGVWMETKSASPTNSSMVTSRTPMALARSGETKGSKPISSMPKAWARWATREPARPSPTTPSTLPCSSTPSHFERSQRPATSGGVGLGDVAGLGQQQGHGLLGHREDVRGRGVDHHDAALGRRGDVDVVEPDAGPAHHLERGAGLEHLGGHLGGGADDQGLRADDGHRAAPRGSALPGRRPHGRPRPAGPARSGRSSRLRVLVPPRWSPHYPP